MDPDENTELSTPDRAVGATGPSSGGTDREPGNDATRPSAATGGAQALPAPKAKKSPASEPDRGPFFTGIWQGRAIYRCPLCHIAKSDRGGLSGDAAVRIHLERHHAQSPTPAERARAVGLVISKR